MGDERKMILQMLQDGKITAEEAERLLKVLNEPAAEPKVEEKSKPSEATPSEFVDWKGWENRKQSYKQASGGLKISQYIESFIQKLKDVDFDFNFGTYETVNHIFQDHPEEVNRIEVDVKNGSVELSPWDEDFVQVDCEVKVYKVASKDEAREKFIRETLFETVNHKLLFACEPRDMKVTATIYIPKKTYDSIDLSLFNGDMNGQAIKAKNLHAKTVNGSITFPGLHVEKAEIETGNGTISVEGKAEDIELETLNGPIKAVGAFRDLDAETFSGLITAKLSEPGVISLKSTTGNVRVSVPKHMQINGELVTAFGSLNCEVGSFEVLREKKEMAQRLLKFVSNKSSTSILTLDANTKTGAITVTEQEG